MIYFLIPQIFIRCLLCTRCCSKTLWLLVSKADKDPCCLGAYILEGRREITNGTHNKEIIRWSGGSKDLIEAGCRGSVGWPEQALPGRGNLSKALKGSRRLAEWNQGKSLLGRGNCGNRDCGPCQECWRDGKSATVAGEECWGGHVTEDKVGKGGECLCVMGSHCNFLNRDMHCSERTGSLPSALGKR